MTSREAYRVWAQSYDAQPNVVATLEESLFASLLGGVSLAGKVVVDVGCGTGRHWPRLLDLGPRTLHGVDDSPEMLAQLRARHPGALLHLRAGAALPDVGEPRVDVIVSTLMLSYAADVAAELREWTRLIERGGEIVLTDFHPAALREGMKRTFTSGGVSFEIEHRVYSVDELRSHFRSLGLEVVAFHERVLDDSVRAVFERQGYLDAYHRFAGAPLVLGFHLHKRA